MKIKFYPSPVGYIDCVAIYLSLFYCYIYFYPVYCWSWEWTISWPKHTKFVYIEMPSLSIHFKPNTHA